TAADLDGDGKEELALGTAYYWWHLINPDGSRRWQYSTLGGPGVTAVAAGDITGNGVPEVLFGGEDSFVQTVDAGGKSVWMFNTGDEITGLAVVRLEEAEPSRVFVSSLSFNVYSLDGQGKLVWRRDLGSPVRSMAVHEQGGHLAAACDNGVFYMLNPRGEVVGMFDNAGRIRDIVPTRLNGKTAFITASDNGYLRAMLVE
ncbi:MAG: PQQ-binding-like beta-propeller repeat protein, partial [Phycisphaerales bacterium]|nr:PQQ-binding-like beta-propeller repeat protein [Phycisphaerales bacterium]